MRLDLTKRSDYAIRAMLSLTKVGGGPPEQPQDRGGDKIPPGSCPDHGGLTRAGLVEAHPGRAGGYKLAKPASTVTLLTVIEAVEGDPIGKSV